MLYYLSAFTQVFIALIAGYFKERFERMNKYDLGVVAVFCLSLVFIFWVIGGRIYSDQPCEHNIDWGAYENTQDMQRV